MTELSEPSYFESFAKICVKDFEERITYPQDFMDTFCEDKEKILLKLLLPEKNKKIKLPKNCWLFDNTFCEEE